jgi:hypothetical protein
MKNQEIFTVFFIFEGLAPESTASGEHRSKLELAGYRMVQSLYMIMGPVLAENYFPFFEKDQFHNPKPQNPNTP